MVRYLPLMQRGRGSRFEYSMKTAERHRRTLTNQRQAHINIHEVQAPTNQQPALMNINNLMEQHATPQFYPWSTPSEILRHSYLRLINILKISPYIVKYIHFTFILYMCVCMFRCVSIFKTCFATSGKYPHCWLPAQTITWLNEHHLYFFS